ncbi:MAG: hypothetical protein ACJ8J0_03125, partial [Longimicrobiaceae bacterium]
RLAAAALPLLAACGDHATAPAAPLASATMRGGGTRYYEFSGTHSAAQLLRLEASGGGTPSSNLRVAVARLQ